ncbi:MAG: hypothetical protein H6828_00640 [Planctomycetes bacterium]|nr:hypothetical protein [Planctomycetota bacterium]
MVRAARFLALALLPLVLAGAARAEALVQLTLRGRVMVEGGAPVEVNVDFWDGTQTKSTSLRLHVANGTSASDVGRLLAGRLRRAGAELEDPAEGGVAEPLLANLFVHGATRVSLRLGYGLWSSVTVCEGVPQSLRVLPPQAEQGDLRLAIGISTFLTHTRTSARVDLALDVKPDAEPSEICERLFEQALAKGLQSERSTADRWTPTKVTDGAQLTGCSIDLAAQRGDWGLEVVLGEPRGR